MLWKKNFVIFENNENFFHLSIIKIIASFSKTHPFCIWRPFSKSHPFRIWCPFTKSHPFCAWCTNFPKNIILKYGRSVVLWTVKSRQLTWIILSWKVYLHYIRDTGKHLKLISTTILSFLAMCGNLTRYKPSGSPMLTNNLIIILLYSLYLLSFPPFFLNLQILPIIPWNHITLKINMTSLKITLPHPFPLTKR